MRLPAMRHFVASAMLALLAVGLLALPAVAAVTDGQAGSLVLAAAAGDEPLGPDPAERSAEDNPARELAGYEDRETPFTWGAAWILAVPGLIGVVAMLGLYHLLVRRPAQHAER